MIPRPAAWRISILVPRRAAEAFAESLDGLTDAVSWLAPEDGSEARVDAFAADEPDPAAVRRVLAETAAAHRCAVPALDIAWLPPRDWVAENRRSFEPFAVGRFFIHDSDHRATVPAGLTGIEVDAGLAFGTGRHESTAGCLAALDSLARRSVRRPLDMGCGSGILSLAVARTWRVPVLAVDVDAAAVAVAAANARANGMSRLLRTECGNGYAAHSVRKRRPFDLIVANILAPPLVRMAKSLAAHLAPGGTAVLSGLQIHEADRVFAAHRQVGLVGVRRIDRGGWRTLVMRKPNRG